jgi:hypothetical protein
MSHGYLAYPIAYFARSRVAAAALAPAWRLTSCSLTDAQGQKTWTARGAPWDFDLASWVERGKLQWIEPEDTEMQLRTAGACPYADLPGERRDQIVILHRRRFVEPPRGDASDPASLEG